MNCVILVILIYTDAYLVTFSPLRIVLYEAYVLWIFSTAFIPIDVNRREVRVIDGLRTEVRTVRQGRTIVGYHSGVVGFSGESDSVKRGLVYLPPAAKRFLDLSSSVWRAV